jgi:hypothetical protein
MSAKRGVPLTAGVDVPRFKPKRDRGVRALSVKCPTCGSEPEVACIAMGERVAAGTPIKSMHRHRRSLAVRADNARREAERNSHSLPS